jgi:hypothetical protein
MAIIYSYPLLGNNLHANDLFVVSDVSSATTPTKSIKARHVAAFINGYNLGYSVYTALVTQVGGSNPTANVLQNSTGATLTWARTSAGLYTVTADSAIFTENKTIVFFESNHIFTQLNWTRTSATVITVNTNEEDDRISNGPLEIRIYA